MLLVMRYEVNDNEQIIPFQLRKRIMDKKNHGQFPDPDKSTPVFFILSVT